MRRCHILHPAQSHPGLSYDSCVCSAQTSCEIGCQVRSMFGRLIFVSLLVVKLVVCICWQTYYSWTAPATMNGLKYASVASAFNIADAWLQYCPQEMQQMRGMLYSLLSSWGLCYICSFLLYITFEDLEASRLLHRVWRIGFVKESKDPCWQTKFHKTVIGTRQYGTNFKHVQKGSMGITCSGVLTAQLGW